MGHRRGWHAGRLGGRQQPRPDLELKHGRSVRRPRRRRVREPVGVRQPRLGDSERLDQPTHAVLPAGPIQHDRYRIPMQPRSRLRPGRLRHFHRRGRRHHPDRPEQQRHRRRRSERLVRGIRASHRPDRRRHRRRRNLGRRRGERLVWRPSPSQ